jgi:glycosyltransferase involved in cell wall biosynthesis
MTFSIETIGLVVPCYNEAKRLNFEAFNQILQLAPVYLIFVDDASTDSTLELLNDFQEKNSSRVTVIGMKVNKGKGEAVRKGITFSFVRGLTNVAYTDADLAIPPREIVRFLTTAQGISNLSLFLGSRVRLLGTQISRSPIRHISGRIFASITFLATGEAIYDTQCGLKLLRKCPEIELAVSVPFRTRWLFDIELLRRLNFETCQVKGRWLKENAVEVPLQVWNEVSGGHLRIRDGLLAFLYIPFIRRRTKY